MTAEEIKNLENVYQRERSLGSISNLIRAYVEQGDPKSLEKALGLVTRNLATFSNEPDFLDPAIEVLGLIKNNSEAARLAVELAKRLVERAPSLVKSYVNAAYLYWRIGNLSAAIELSELGLRQLGRHPAATLAFLKGNLAYYYAERGLDYDAEKALRLAHEAYEAEVTGSRADTLGYVILRFAKTKSEVQEALRYFNEAKAELDRLGARNPWVVEHIEKATAKIKDMDVDPGGPS